MSLRHDKPDEMRGGFSFILRQLHRSRYAMLPANITVRLGTLADAGEIAEMSRELIETGLGWAWTRARVARNIVSTSTVTLAACDAERLIGFSIMYFGDDHAHLNLLAVRPPWQRAGIGRYLVRWLEESALVAGVGTIRLELRASNRGARRFYGRLGYAEVARVPEYYGGVESAIRMARDIRRGKVGPLPNVLALLRRP
jgi:ribosomal-protein-alanine N-acetyltransferase